MNIWLLKRIKLSVQWKRWGIVFVILLMLWVWQQLPDEKLHVYFCDVGQGDGALIVLGSFQAVIDTGAYVDTMTSCLSRGMPFWDRKIEIVFLSHSDKDHVGALQGLRQRYSIGKVIDSPKSGDLIRYGLLSFDVVKGSEPVVEKVDVGGSISNERSVVMRVAYNKFSAMFAGDMDLGSELALVSKGVLRKSQVLKVSHHGSKYGSSQVFLNMIMPKIAVISVGAKNNYGHPNGDTLLRLDVVGSKVLRTDLIGTVHLVTDGDGMQVLVSR